MKFWLILALMFVSPSAFAKPIIQHLPGGGVVYYEGNSNQTVTQTANGVLIESHSSNGSGSQSIRVEGAAGSVVVSTQSSGVNRTSVQSTTSVERQTITETKDTFWKRFVLYALIYIGYMIVFYLLCFLLLNVIRWGSKEWK